MFKKIALISITAMMPWLSANAAGCQDISTFQWVYDGGYCPKDSNCIVQWKGYGWWTNFHANKDNWFYESKQAWDPRNAFVDGNDRLQLQIRQSNLGGGTTWTAAEAVLVSKAGEDGQEFNIGYGHYLVTFELPTSIADQDPATVFGAFTYYRDPNNSASPTVNNLKELDMVEVSKWAWDGTGSCPFYGDEQFLCHGSYQLGTQPYKVAGNLQRYPEQGFPKPTESTVTLYMHWQATSVDYKVFSGVQSMATAQDPSTKGDMANWSIPADKTQFIPDPSGPECIRFHLNYYRPVWNDPDKVPADSNGVSMYVTNFEYLPQ